MLGPARGPAVLRPWWALALVLLAAALAAWFDLRATSTGWHVAAGRVMLAEHRIVETDTLTFTATGTPWLDHEWGFQILAAAVDSLGGPPALVVFRMVLVSLLAGVVFASIRGGVTSPPLALLLTTVMLSGARMRFFVRPELITLIVTAAVIGLALRDRRGWRQTAAIAALVILGVNAHGGVLVVPILLAGVAGGRVMADLLNGAPLPRALARELPIPLAAGVATLVNPWGWRIWEVPFHLAELVGSPWIPNPEWISPGPPELPHLWLGIAAIAAILALGGERDPARWFVAVMVTALALRYVRNVGLFFVVAVIIVGPALDRLVSLVRRDRQARFERLVTALGLCLIIILPLNPRYSPSLAESEQVYPVHAAAFLERHGLLPGRLYHDVRFGGWLIGRYHPGARAFIDDRNEIHEDTLEQLWRIWRSSRPDLLEELLARWHLDVAVVHHRPPVEVVSPDGSSGGLRGWSVLWFPPERWALVYFDDTAMVLVRRQSFDRDWVRRFEYAELRPDDLIHTMDAIRRDPVRTARFQAELERRLRSQPPSHRALAIAEAINPRGSASGP